MDKCIVMVGCISDGYKSYGPFEDFEDACDFADGCFDNTWIATLHDPESEDSGE